MGHPGKVRRSTTPADLDSIDQYAARYVGYKNTYLQEVQQ